MDRRQPATAVEPEAQPLDAPAIYEFPSEPSAFLPWSAVEERLRESQNYWLATTRPDGRPHVAPLWGAWIAGAFYFQGAPESRWARNLLENPAASLNLESGNDAVIVDGVVSFAGADDVLAARFIAEWRRKYGDFEPAPETVALYSLQPRAARAWGENLNDGARWVFAGASTGHTASPAG